MNTQHFQQQPTVFVVDDDEVDLERFSRLFHGVEVFVETFSTPQAFLLSFDSNRSGCLVLDYHMPIMNGLELQKKLISQECRLPIVLISGCGEVDSCANAFRAGAFDFVEKSITDDALFETISRAIEFDAKNRERRSKLNHLISKISDREKEVLELVVIGKTVKQISQLLGIAFATAAKHRSRILEKIGAETDVELVNILRDNGFSRQSIPSLAS